MTASVRSVTYRSPLHQMTQTTPTCLWNHSADIDELTHSIEDGAVGVSAWQRRLNASGVDVIARIDDPVDPAVVGKLLSHLLISAARTPSRASASKSSTTLEASPRGQAPSRRRGASSSEHAETPNRDKG